MSGRSQGDRPEYAGLYRDGLCVATSEAESHANGRGANGVVPRVLTADLPPHEVLSVLVPPRQRRPRYSAPLAQPLSPVVHGSERPAGPDIVSRRLARS